MYGNRTALNAPIKSGTVSSLQQQSVHNQTDDHERWYTEVTANNRMRLSLLSGIDGEVSWALNRLVRLCRNEDFRLRQIPGLMEALFEWPEWFSTTGYKEYTNLHSVFAPPITLSLHRQHAIMSAFVLRNAALIDDHNARAIAEFSRTIPLVLYSLHNLDFTLDINCEFLLYVLDIFLCVTPTFVLPLKSSKPTSSPLESLLRISSSSSNRSMIMAAFNALSSLFSNPQNAHHLSPTSPTLSACIRYLPLYTDKPLLEGSLSYLYAHLSHPAMSKAFLLHPDMPSVLRILITLLLVEQMQETVTVDIAGDYHTVPSAVLNTKDHELSQAELDGLLALPEPKRCFDWLALMFIKKPGGEVTQIDLWNLYRETWEGRQEPFPMLPASDVIKNATTMFGTQSLVLPGPRFVIQDIQRRKDTVLADKLKCQWDRSKCAAPPLSNAAELCEHVMQHVDSYNIEDEAACLWSTCSKDKIPRNELRAHVFTHFWQAHIPSERNPSQSDTITISPSTNHPDPNPTKRTPPLPRRTAISFQRTINDAPSTSLLALLCIRILFQTSFASVEAAPKVDADHFGFPGMTEETDDDDEGQFLEGFTLEHEKEGGRRGRRAFGDMRKLLEVVQIKDDVLMGWITEMINVGIEECG
ncbi:hypothetical protein EV361DRAFT_876492 [Lentinula raphanica]|uniref:RFX-type winged-helix domain-containing protein n=1 Tax=Lentinula raphanica TaxID=153919 RepID=A0AA38PLK4_9AGAR|nr:hypothetical protein F5880DRAFT_169851 [Lentinula raphanica]KAJ3844961.1 hypothetical protein F5878DRAFT_600691 [Lentinula raphanica]KAJ3977869.1 hypothetical protein EV361DRAFT_876492 [Lentinula raphanica]